MNNYMHRLYSKEEEFYDKYFQCVHAAHKLMGDQWEPNSKCSDTTRNNRDYFLKSGELKNLTFNSAAVYHNEHGFSSCQIALVSAVREVTVKVEKQGSEFAASIVVDRPK